MILDNRIQSLKKPTIMKLFLTITTLMVFSFIGNSQSTTFKKHSPGQFSIELPVDMKLSKMYDQSSPDYSDFEVKLKDGYVIMELHSLINSRFEYSTIKELYDAALNSSKLDITYKMTASNYFVISGFNKENGNIVYWKRVLGENFVSDMHIEYSKSRKNDIEQHIGKIAKSFTSR